MNGALDITMEEASSRNSANRDHQVEPEPHQLRLSNRYKRPREPTGLRLAKDVESKYRTLQGVTRTVYLRLETDATGFAAQMTNIVLMVELATNSLGMVTEQAVEDSV
jgi:hypothetical protein